MLCAIGQSLAASLASGASVLIGEYGLDVFGEAAASCEGVIEVDFLGGCVTRGTASVRLRAARDDVRELSATFCAAAPSPRATLAVVDRCGRATRTAYVGYELRRLQVLDPLGRVRRVPRWRIAVGA